MLSSASPGRLALAVLAIGLGVATLAAYTGHRVEQVVRGQLSATLNAPHHAAIAGLALWCDAAARVADAAAHDRVAAPLLTACARVMRTPQASRTIASPRPAARCALPGRCSR